MAGRGVGVIRESRQAQLVLQPLRRSLLARLDRPASAATLARELGLPRQRVNYHLRELEREGLLACVEERRKGNCVERVMRAVARSFVISPDAIGPLDATPADAQDRFSAASLMTAAAQALRRVAALDEGARAAGRRLATFTAELDVRFASARRRAAFVEDLTGCLAALAAKYDEPGVPGGRRFRVLTLLHPHPASVTDARPRAGVDGGATPERPGES